MAKIPVTAPLKDAPQPVPIKTGAIETKYFFLQIAPVFIAKIEL